MAAKLRWTEMILLGACCALLAGCRPETSAVPPTATVPPTAAESTPGGAPEGTLSPAGPDEGLSGELFLGYAGQRADGNRLVSGAGAVPSAQWIDLPLEDTPVWVAAVPAKEGSLWVAVFEDGHAQAYHVFAADRVEPAEVFPDAMPAGMPPLLYAVADQPALAVPPSETASTLSPAVLLTGTMRLAYLEENGDLVVDDGYHEWKEAINALPDARLLVDEQDRILLLGDATDRYPHGALGDTLEAGSIQLVRTDPVPQVLRSITIDSPAVVEGVAPLWTDLDGDGTREILVTVSDDHQGARLVVYAESGEQLAASPGVGQGSRWRHLIAAGPFGPEGEMELVDVLTPHLEPVVEFFRMEGNELRRVAQLEGYTSHVLSSRNLDQAAGGDFDGDGRREVLLMTPDRTELAAVQHTAAGAEMIWSVPAGGKITTNLGAAVLRNGKIAVGVGTEAQTLRLWLP